MALDRALFTMLKRLATIFITPRALLVRLPGKMFREAHESFTEVTKYFEEFRSGAAENMEVLASKRNKTILGRYNRYRILAGNTEWLQRRS